MNSIKKLSRYITTGSWIRNTWQENPEYDMDYPDGYLLSEEEWNLESTKKYCTPDDGSGYWATVFTEGDTFLESKADAFSPKPEGANCVTWYDK
jgi:hypothetical protein